jgi:hypothetical protein
MGNLSRFEILFAIWYMFCDTAGNYFHRQALRLPPQNALIGNEGGKYQNHILSPGSCPIPALLQSLCNGRYI